MISNHTSNNLRIKLGMDFGFGQLFCVLPCPHPSHRNIAAEAVRPMHPRDLSQMGSHRRQKPCQNPPTVL